jgi:hypothetical protein
MIRGPLLGAHWVVVEGLSHHPVRFPHVVRFCNHANATPERPQIDRPTSASDGEEIDQARTPNPAWQRSTDAESGPVSSPLVRGGSVLVSPQWDGRHPFHQSSGFLTNASKPKRFSWCGDNPSSHEPSSPEGGTAAPPATARANRFGYSCETARTTTFQLALLHALLTV